MTQLMKCCLISNQESQKKIPNHLGFEYDSGMDNPNSRVAADTA